MNQGDSLNAAQKEAILHLDGPLLVVAGAGAGKTRVIVQRIAHLMSQDVNPSAILAITFTNKAAGEMRERVVKMVRTGSTQPFISTFHALAARLLREFASEAGVPRNFTIWDRDDSIRTIKRTLKQEGSGLPPRTFVAAISREKGAGVTYDKFLSRVRTPFHRETGEVWRQYETALREEGALDFDDLLLKTHGLLESRGDVRGALQRRWSHILVDEYQDTSATQYEIVRLLAGDARNVCVVGDLDQCIYTWRQAKLENLLTFEKSFPGTKVVTLEQNYRSTQTILTAANGIIEKNRNRYPKRLFTENGTGEPIALFTATDEREEARYVAETIRELLGSGVRASDIAVLYRENFQSRALEEAAIALGIPYRVVGTRFFERAEVKDVLSYARAALNPQSRSDFERAAASPPRGIGKTTLEKVFAGAEGALGRAAREKVLNFRALLERIRRTIETESVTRALHFIAKESGLERALMSDEETRERLLNIRELISLAARYDALSGMEGVERLLEDAALMSEQDALALPENQNTEAVSLMTVHASKGLEFDAVFITGLEQGLFPSVRESDDRDPEEERRLFYVSLTRARKNVFLTHALARQKYGSRESALPSEFLEDIDPRLVARTGERKRGLLDSFDVIRY